MAEDHMEGKQTLRTARRSGGVLDLRDAHVVWRISPGRATTVNDKDLAELHGLYDAILRDGRLRLSYTPEKGRHAGSEIECIELTRESLRRLRDAIIEEIGFE